MAIHPCDYYVRPTNGDDSNDGLSFASAFKSWQKALNTVVAGKTIGLVAESEEIISTTIIAGVAGSIAAGFIKSIALMADGSLDITGNTIYWINGNNAVADLFKTNVNYHEVNGIGLKNATRDCWTQGTTSYYWIIKNCHILNAGRHGFNLYSTLRASEFIGCTATSCVQLGFYLYQAIVQKCFATLCATGYNTNASTYINKCIAAVCTTGYAVGANDILVGNIADTCTTAITGTSSVGSVCANNKLTHCNNGIVLTTGWLYSDRNGFFDVTTKETPGTGRIVVINTNVDLPADGYVNRASGDYNSRGDDAYRRVVSLVPYIAAHVTPYETIGIPGADVYPQDFYLDRSVVSVTAGTLITVTLKHLDSSLMTGLTLKGVACTDRIVTGVNTLTFVTPTLTAGIGNIEGIITGYENYVIYNGITATNDAPPPGPDTVMGMLIKLHKQFYGTGKIEESPSGSGRFYLVLYDNDGGETDTVIAKCELKGYGGSAVASFVGNTSPCVRLKSMIDVVPTIPESATVLGILEKMINYEFGKKIQKEIPVGSGKFYEVTYDSAGTEIGRCPLKAYGGAEIASPEGSTEPVERLRSIV
jgi:hypothetical protein